MSELISMRSGRSSKMELETIIKVCSSLKRGNAINLLEVGVYQGESSEIFLNTGLVSKLYCVDPWTCGYDDRDDASKTDMTAVERAFDSRVTSRYGNVVKHKGTIGTFVETKFDHIDVVYIDGSHRYEDVLNDIQTAIDHIRPSIAISGHDYFWSDGTKPCVQNAVNRLLGYPDMILGMASWMKLRNTYSWS